MEIKYYTQEEIKKLLQDERTENLIDYVREYIENTCLTYYDDVQEAMEQYSNIIDVLNGEYTMDDLMNDLENDCLSSPEEMTMIIDDYLEEELIKEVLDL